MLLKLRLLIMVDESICDYQFLKKKLDNLTIEVAQLELVTDNHWGMAVRWFDDRWKEYRNSLSKKKRLGFGERETSYPYHVYQRTYKESIGKRKKRIKNMVRKADRVVVFWDGFSHVHIKRVMEKANQLGKPITEVLI